MAPRNAPNRTDAAGRILSAIAPDSDEWNDYFGVAPLRDNPFGEQATGFEVTRVCRQKLRYARGFPDFY